MKWLLIMQLMFSNNHGGGATVETQYFETKAQCETVAKVFLNNLKTGKSGRWNEIYTIRKAVCIGLK